jgi:branched-chain amino acid transport system substrate-binding protein
MEANNSRKEKVMSQKESWKNGVTRRDFIKTVGAAGIATVGGTLLPRSSPAAARDHILIGRPGPWTGPLAELSAPGPWASKRAQAEINRDGGIFIKDLGKKLPVKFKSVDTQSDSAKSAELASKLILRDKVDVMVVTGGPDIINPVSAVCERNEVPCIAYCPHEPWLTGAPYKWSFDFFWSVKDVFDVYIGMWGEVADKTNKVVGGLWGSDPEGVVWSTAFPGAFKDLGYKLVDPGRFPINQADFTSFINIWKKEKVEILTGTVAPPVWSTAWRQCHQQGFNPKIVTIAKACLFPAAMEALGGNLADGLSTEIWWTPQHPYRSSLGGYSCKELADAWTEETGKQWTQPLGYEYAAFEIMLDALKRAGSLNKEKIRNAIIRTDMETVAGPIKFNKNHTASTPLVGGQWVKGKKWPWDLQITYNEKHPQIATTGKMIFPVPR